jgi:hypothetical protein
VVVAKVIALWLPILEMSKVDDPTAFGQISREFESVDDAVIFAIEELDAADRVSLDIRTDEGSVEIRDIEAKYDRLRRAKC